VISLLYWLDFVCHMEFSFSCEAQSVVTMPKDILAQQPRPDFFGQHAKSLGESSALSQHLGTLQPKGLSDRGEVPPRPDLVEFYDRCISDRA
jgi:hypothetical protein